MSVLIVLVCWVAAGVRIQTTIIRGPRLRGRLLLTGAIVAFSFAETTLKFMPYVSTGPVRNAALYLSFVGGVLTMGFANAYLDELIGRIGRFRTTRWVTPTVLALSVTTFGWLAADLDGTSEHQGLDLVYGRMPISVVLFYLGTYVPVAVTLLRVVWVNSHLPKPDDRLTRTGLRLVTTAMVVGALGFITDIAAVLMRAFGATGHQVQGPYRVAQSVTGLAAAILVVGVALMAAAPTTGHLTTERRRRNQLYPLWSTLTSEFPDVRLSGPRSATRMTVEITDALRHTRFTPPTDHEMLVSAMVQAIQQHSTTGVTSLAEALSRMPSQDDVLADLSQQLRRPTKELHAS